VASPEVKSPDRILLQALQLFSSKGYDATSVREICEAAGITKPTLYHFFGSKEGVYRALVDGSLEEFRRDLLAQIQAPGAAGDRLKRVARRYFENVRAHRELMRFVLGLIHHPPSSAPVTDFRRFYEELVRLIARVVEEGVKEGTLSEGPTEVRMLVLMGALGEAICGNLISGRPDLTPALADTLVETVIRGWAGRQPTA
jgi:TetR/AcrR family transcriptional regulator